MSDRLGVAILGLDNWYHAYPFAQALASMENASLLAIADPDQARARWAAERYGAAAWYTSYEQAIHHPGVQAVVLTMYTAAHAEVGMVAAAAGRHLLCDKPIEVSLARADALLDAAQNHGVILMMAFGRRFSPVYQRGRDLLRSGAIGQPTAVVEIGRWPLPRVTPERWEPGWYAQAEKSGGGAFLDHAVHQVDALRWLLSSEVTEVSAVMGNLVHRTLPVEDYGIATLRFASGAIATIESTWTVVPPARTTDELYIGGTEGEIVLSSSAPQIRLYSKSQGGGVLYDLPLGPGIEVVAGHTIHVQQYQGVVEAFVRAALRGEEPPVTGRDGRAASEVCLAAYESARCGRTVRLHT